MCDYGGATQTADNLMNCPLLLAVGNGDIFSVNTAAVTWQKNLPDVWCNNGVGKTHRERH